MSKPVGRPRHEPTPQNREIAEALSGFGIPYEKIAQVLKITKPTLIEHYKAELDRGGAVVEANLVGNLMRLSKGNDGTALKATIFALSCRFGWSQYAPGPVDVTPNLEDMGKKERQQLEAHTAHEDTEWAHLLPN